MLSKSRFIFMVGGVMSGIGKGVATASIGRLLQDKGFKVRAVKIDPYINVDAGTMNPVEHGEVFVTEDGVECDQDGGNYERFLDVNFSDDSYITTGRVYRSVIERERNLGYQGRCVQVMRDISNEVVSRLERLERKTGADFILVEIGGTVGDHENVVFLEAARRIKLARPEDVLFILISYLPVPPTIGEMKTKPTQQAAKWLSMTGIQPDIILGRAKVPLDEPRREKISVFCNVEKEYVVSAPDVENVYKVPLNFRKEKLGEKILRKFGAEAEEESGLEDWKALVRTVEGLEAEVNIGLVGKYFKTGEFTLRDSYISVIEAVKHASWSWEREPELEWLSAEKYEERPERVKELAAYDGIIILGGFGKRGVEGKIEAIRFAREKHIPLFGLCLGLQLMTVEFGRHLCGLEGANSTEFAPETPHPVIDIMKEQKDLLKEDRYGGTMRLGVYKCRLRKGTKSSEAYGQEVVEERHRHRYELNNDYRERLKNRGLVMAGVNPKRNLVEIVEIKKHPFAVGTQFHPEFKSRPLRPHPLFRAFIGVALEARS